ncbi:hypothetical protein EDB87DRAFT_1569667, partial [Lactarius vividus]
RALSALLSQAAHEPHEQHCLNYLRQKELCHPDLTLEPIDFATREFEVDRVRQTCLSSESHNRQPLNLSLVFH